MICYLWDVFWLSDFFCWQSPHTARWAETFDQHLHGFSWRTWKSTGMESQVTCCSVCPTERVQILHSGLWPPIHFVMLIATTNGNHGLTTWHAVGGSLEHLQWDGAYSGRLIVKVHTSSPPVKFHPALGLFIAFRLVTREQPHTLNPFWVGYWRSGSCNCISAEVGVFRRWDTIIL